MPVNEKLDELIPGALLREPREVYDAAVIGATFDGRAIYVRDQVVEAAMEADGMEWEDAAEWHEFNTFCAYHGPKTPIFVSLD